MQIDLSRLPSDEPIRPELNAAHWSHAKGRLSSAQYGAYKDVTATEPRNYNVFRLGDSFFPETPIARHVTRDQAVKLVRWCVENDKRIHEALADFYLHETMTSFFALIQEARANG